MNESRPGATDDGSSALWLDSVLSLGPATTPARLVGALAEALGRSAFDEVVPRGAAASDGSVPQAMSVHANADGDQLALTWTHLTNGLLVRVIARLSGEWSEAAEVRRTGDAAGDALARVGGVVYSAVTLHRRGVDVPQETVAIRIGAEALARTGGSAAGLVEAGARPVGHGWVRDVVIDNPQEPEGAEILAHAHLERLFEGSGLVQYLRSGSGTRLSSR